MTADLDADAAVPAGGGAVALELARRFEAGATLWCRAATHDDHARHVAVEFLHPAVLGARALPAVALGAAHADDALAMLASPQDAVLTLAPRDDRASGGTTTDLAGPWPVTIHTADALGWFDGRVVRTYHLLWELVQLCFERLAGLGGTTGGSADRSAGAGGDPTGFLYPFLDRPAPDAGAEADLLADLDASAAAKVASSTALAASSVRSADLPALAAAVASRLRRGGRLLTIGNGGSAADAGLFAALCLRPPSGRPLAARSLAADAVVTSALANDLGAGEVFARQVDTHVRPDDVVVAFSTSGTSVNVCAGLARAHRRGALTVAFAGYDGGALAGSGDVDHCVVVASDSVHRIQEAHAALGVALWRQLQVVGA